MKMFEKYVNNKNLSVLVGDVNSKIEIEENIDYIIHTAAVTKSKVLKDCPVETTLTAILGTKNVLDLASENILKEWFICHQWKLMEHLKKFYSKRRNAWIYRFEKCKKWLC